MQRLTLIIPGEPIPQPRQRHRVATDRQGRAFSRNYTPAKHPVREYKEAIQLIARSQFRDQPHEGPIRVHMVLLFPRPTRLVWKRKPMPREPKISVPDCDNVAKSIQDALKGIVFRDDAQIFSVTIEKFYAAGDEQPHAEVLLSLL